MAAQKDLKAAMPTLKELAAALAKKHGEGAAMLLSSNSSQIKQVDIIPTGSYALNAALGCGGWPRGRIVEVYGAESSGKSTLCLHGCANAQAMGHSVFYLDAEHALDLSYARSLGVKVGQMLVGQPDSAEQGLSMVEDVVSSGSVGLVVVDSVAALTPQAELDGEMEDQQMGLQARIMGKAMRKLCAIISRTNTLVLFVNQTRCVAVDTQVFTDKGLISAASAVKTRKIAGLSGKLTKHTAIESGIQSGVTIETDDGRSITCSGSHPFLVKRTSPSAEWCEAKKLTEGMWVAVHRRPELAPSNTYKFVDVDQVKLAKNAIAVATPTEMTPNLAKFLGMWYADGSLIDGRDKFVSFTENSSERMSVLSDVVKKLGWHYRRSENTLQLPKSVFLFLQSIGCQSGGRNKTVPACIQSKIDWKWFLHGMFDTHIVKSAIVMTSENFKEGQRIQNAMQALGVTGRLHKVRGSAHIRVSGSDALAYLSNIGFSETSKAQKLKSLLEEIDYSSRGKADVIPFPKALIEKFSSQRALWKTVPEDLKSRLRAIKCAKLHMAVRDYEFLCKHFSVEPELLAFKWVKVSSIRKSPETEMVDFEVPIGNAFIANGFVTHNCKIGIVYGSPNTTPGGNALKFYASVRVELARQESLKVGDRVVGSKVRAKVVKNKMAPPFRQAVFEVAFGRGINAEAELFDAAFDAGLVKRAGAWMSMETWKFQGRDAFLAAIREDKNLRSRMEDIAKNVTETGNQESADDVSLG